MTIEVENEIAIAVPEEAQPLSLAQERASTEDVADALEWLTALPSRRWYRLSRT